MYESEISKGSWNSLTVVGLVNRIAKGRVTATFCPFLILLASSPLSFSPFLFFLFSSLWRFLKLHKLEVSKPHFTTYSNYFLIYFGIFVVWHVSWKPKTPGIPSPWGCHLHQRRWRLQIVPHALLSRRQKLNGLYRMTCQRSTISVSHFEIGAVLVGEAVKIKIAELIRTADIRKVSMSSRWSHVKSPDAFQASASRTQLQVCSHEWLQYGRMFTSPKWWISLSKSMKYEEWFRYAIENPNAMLFLPGEHSLDELPQWERQNRPKTPPCSPKLIVPPAEIPSSFLACNPGMKNLKDQ